MSGRLSPSEQRCLRALDWICYEDAEQGGGGWASRRDVEDELEVGHCWTRQLLGLLVARGFAERKPNGRRYLYALTDTGAELLAELPDSFPADQEGS